jgi:hypothetical protein
MASNAGNDEIILLFSAREYNKPGKGCLKPFEHTRAPAFDAHGERGRANSHANNVGLQGLFDGGTLCSPSIAASAYSMTSGF